MRIKTYLFTILSLCAAVSVQAQTESELDSLLYDSINETVVVGFSRTKKVNLIGAVQQVKMSDVVSDRPVVSTAAALQGTIPGLSVSGASKPGQPKEFNIRGQLSINGGSPLILIDNMRETSTVSIPMILRALPF